MTAPLRVVLAEDHLIVRQGLRALLETTEEFVIVAEGGDGFETVEAVEREQPDVVLLDLSIPGPGIVETIRTTLLSKNGEQIPVAISGTISYDENGEEDGTIGFAKDLREILRRDQLATLGEVAIGLSHEINNPLAVILNQIELLEREVDTLAGEADTSVEFERLDAMRRAEGERLGAELERAIAAIEAAAVGIERRAVETRDARQATLMERVQTLAGELGLEEGRLYQEVVRAVERHDVAEEIQRLRSHAAMARELVSRDEGPAGKRLDFLAQELMREANTIGSKVADADQVQAVVGLKAEIERLREQVQNVE